MKIDSVIFEKALATLKESLAAKKDEGNFIRDSAIQRFEYTYGMSIKFMQRQLENMVAESEEVERMAFPTMVRTAAEKGLVDDPVAWLKYREMRNITSHTYDEAKAEQVYSVLHDFAKSAEYLLNKIKQLNS